MSEVINLSKQTINLTKGQIINLSKDNHGLNKIMIGLGWDENKGHMRTETYMKQPGFIARLFGAQPQQVTKEIWVEKNGTDYDLDAWLYLSKPVNRGYNFNSSDLLYYGNKHLNKSRGEAAWHHGDNLVGGSGVRGDDEQMSLTLNNVPSEYNEILVGVTIYRGSDRNQTFGDIQNVFVRVVDERDNFEICRYNSGDVSNEYKDCYTFIVGKFIRKGNEWEFESIGRGTRDKDISSAVKSNS